MALGKTLLQLIYPTFCLHCDCEVESVGTTLCPACLSQIEWGSKRCYFCGAFLENGHLCKRCQVCPIHLHPHTSLFLPQGPIVSLYKDFLKTGVAKNLAALMVIGMNRYALPMPEGIISLSYPRKMGFFIKNQPPFLLAKSVSKFLGCPLVSSKKCIAGKIIMVVCDWLKDSEVLKKKEEELREFFPEKIYSCALIDGR